MQRDDEIQRRVQLFSVCAYVANQRGLGDSRDLISSPFPALSFGPVVCYHRSTQRGVVCYQHSIQRGGGACASSADSSVFTGLVTSNQQNHDCANSPCLCSNATQYPDIDHEVNALKSRKAHVV
jgi:hypothetical protein